jgi:hypothetical protein
MIQTPSRPTQRYFSFEKGSGTQRVIQNSFEEGVMLVIPMPGKKVRNADPACVLTRYNIRNGVPVRSDTKIPLDLPTH